MAVYSGLTTESVNEKTRDIDKKSALEIARAVNDEDKTVAFAVERALPDIAKGIDVLAEVIKNGGCVYYCGAGTSGRLGVLDASECVPTFGVSPDTFVGLMAGGTAAIYESHETAEDDLYSISCQLKERRFGRKDALVAISASGSANCVKGALLYAKQKGAKTLCVTCNPNSDLVPMCEIPIVAEVGPEVITGSTRMKA
ncbi:MAG: N-acetylmuramic acid 6-phosphate etherase, partial [Clostridia bacterium]|nr:N-acetylmuramic acid 6-phosphate etherase [Clostridia bacterium]